jgi:hypothetical protein
MAALHRAAFFIGFIVAFLCNSLDKKISDNFAYASLQYL